MAPERLVLLREAHDLSQRDLANILDVSQAHISLLEAGKKKASTELVEKAAAYFRVAVWVLHKPPGCASWQDPCPPEPQDR